MSDWKDRLRAWVHWQRQEKTGDYADLEESRRDMANDIQSALYVIAQLEAENARLKGDKVQLNERWTETANNLVEARALLAEAEGALEYYADHSRWATSMDISTGKLTEAFRHEGQFGCDRAKAALAKLRAGKVGEK